MSTWIIQRISPQGADFLELAAGARFSYPRRGPKLQFIARAEALELHLPASPGRPVTLNTLPLQPGSSHLLRTGDFIRHDADAFLVSRKARSALRTSERLEPDVFQRLLSLELAQGKTGLLAMGHTPPLPPLASRRVAARLERPPAAFPSVVRTEWCPGVLLLWLPGNAAAEEASPWLGEVHQRIRWHLQQLPGHDRDTFEGPLERGRIALWPDGARHPTVFASPLSTWLLSHLEAALRAGRQPCLVGEPGSGRRALLKLAAERVQLPESTAFFADTPEQVPLGTTDVLYVPALSERPEDAAALVRAAVPWFRHVLEKPRLQLDPRLPERLAAVSWPGHATGLLNSLFFAVLSARRETLGSEDFAPLRAEEPPRTLRETRAGSERTHLLEVLARTRWNVSLAARQLEVPRRTLVWRMARLGLRRPRPRRALPR